MIPQHYETVLAGDDVRTVAAARRWTREALTGAGLPVDVVDDALTCVSELATNACRYTASGEPGGKYRVIVEVTGRQAHVEVVDQGADHGPDVLLGAAGESGRGLWICATLGVLQHQALATGGRRVWVDLPHPAPPVPAAHSADGSER
ncbi:ATP-binding protein [Actinomadura sp. WAC 06369]|uniref:ATP-binding protein n=1 Tax=Actinomadura sp. WAC 06369 TaxID=2203193 RepID=UPI000F78E6E6|nr:ATP-binding protein [Actinomadura sp. WAC 06369]RSN53316.1 ATP-binding protein [Actinomadura sp. WAC 06369]